MKISEIVTFCSILSHPLLKNIFGSQYSNTTTI